MQLVLATSNQQKAQQISQWLARPVQHIAIDLPEVQAIAVDEVIEAKARAAYLQVGQPVLVEDTGLHIDAWQGLPGALIRWFLESVGNHGICTMLANFTQRTASAVTCIGYFDGSSCHIFRGVTTGTIAVQPRGDHGFGWDPIFIPAGLDKTFAELTTAERATVSMRHQATVALKQFFDEQGL